MFDEYNRNTFKIKAVQITKDNINEASRLVGDTVRINLPKYGDRTFFYIPVKGRGYHLDQNVPVFLDDWLTFGNGKYRRYSNDAFLSTFTKKDPNNKQREIIEKYIYAAIVKANNNGESTLDITKKATELIMGELGIG